MTGDVIEAAKAVLRGDIEAAKAATPGPWREATVNSNRYAALVSDMQPEGRVGNGGWDYDDGYGGYLIGESLQPPDRHHIARQSPDRVIRQAQAMLAILDAPAGTGMGTYWAGRMARRGIAEGLAHAIVVGDDMTTNQPTTPEPEGPTT